MAAVARLLRAGPYEDERQARADVADIYERALHSMRRGALAEANNTRLGDACERAGVMVGAYDARILAGDRRLSASFVARTGCS